MTARGQSTRANAKRDAEDANVNGKSDASPPAKKKKETPSVSSTTAPVPPVIVKANPDHVSHTYIKFGSLPPSPQVKEKLDGLLNDVPISSLIDANVAHLFDNVENSEQFILASFVFWLSVFANQRGLPCSHHDFLLEQLISKSESDFYKTDTSFDTEFKRVHNALMEHFRTKLECLVEGFLKSPAGAFYLGEFENARKSKGKLSEMIHPLVTADIHNYKTHAGLSFEKNEVFDFWQPILLLDDVYFDSEKSNIPWLASEVGRLNESDSWFQRLARVTMELVTALVNVCAPDQGRTKKSLLDSPILYERFLLSVPTYPDTHFAPTPGSPRTPTHFPTRIRSLKQWESIVMKNVGIRQILGMESTDDDDSEMTSNSEDESTESEDLSDHNMPAQEMVNEVPAEMIVEAREAEEQVDDDQVASFIEEVSQFDPEAENQPADAILSVHSYPPIFHPPLATKFAHEMTELNIYGQTKLMSLKLKNRQKYLHSLSAKALKEADELSKLRNDLKTELEECEAAERYYKKACQESASLKSQVRGMKGSIEKSRANPELNRIIDDKKKPLSSPIFKFPRHRTHELLTPIPGSTAIRPSHSTTPRTPTPNPVELPHARRSSVYQANSIDLDAPSSDEDNAEPQKPEGDQRVPGGLGTQQSGRAGDNTGSEHTTEAS